MQNLIDLLPLIFFYAAYQYGGMPLAIPVIMAAVAIQVAVTWVLTKKVHKLTLGSAVLVVVLGGASLLVQSPTVFKWKPTILFWVMAGIFLGSHFIGSRPRGRSHSTSPGLACILAAFIVDRRVRPWKASRHSRSESAHCLPNVPEGHKCARVHGHSFRVEIHVSGPVDARTGWVMDFADIRTAFDPLFQRLDHRYLNDVRGLENPTSENLARWVWRELKPALPQFARVVVHETCTSGAGYSGDDSR